MFLALSVQCHAADNCGGTFHNNDILFPNYTQNHTLAQIFERLVYSMFYVLFAIDLKSGNLLNTQNICQPWPTCHTWHNLNSTIKWVLTILFNFFSFLCKNFEKGLNKVRRFSTACTCGWKKPHRKPEGAWRCVLKKNKQDKL